MPTTQPTTVPMPGIDGEEVLVGTYSFLDLLPKGRDENGPNYNLMDWVKRHDMYEDGNSSDATAPT